jgi:4-amino-4-deoxy-L-arabinose transferase-like glycosyltransferase
MSRVEERRQPFITRAGWWVAALIPILLGFGLRLRYVLHAEPFVDEPTTLLVAQAIASTGVPVLPSGLFYGNDLPFSYLSGGLVALFGPHLEVLRALSLAASVTTIGLVYLVGRRLFTPWAGLWAALLLALCPEAITWGGRARAYALLGLLVLLAVWLFYAGLVSGRRGQRRLGLVLLVLAAFVHPEAALLLPAFVLGGVLLKGWHWWLRPGHLVELLLAAAGLAARYWLQLALAQGQIGGFATVSGSRPPLELSPDWLARLEAVAPLFLAPERLPWTILALLALAVAVGTRWRKGPSSVSSAVLYLSLCLWSVPLAMVLLLGSSYQSPRYLTMLLPLFALLAAAGLDWLLSSLIQLVRLDRWPALMPGLAAVALLAIYLPGALAASDTTEKGFQSALAYVQQHWQAGDRVATVAPAYSQLVLGRNDYFALGSNYEEFAYLADDGQLVDRWLGSPLIRSAGELNAVLDAGGRLWFVTDEGRFRRRFDQVFAQTVWDRMVLAAKTDQVMVFVAHAPSEVASINRNLGQGAVFGEQVALVGYGVELMAGGPEDAGLGEVVAGPGGTLPVTLYWQAVAPVSQDYTVFLHLLGPDGERYAQHDDPPLRGIQPMTHWQAGEVLPDRRLLELPVDMSPGRYRLEVGLYELTTGHRLPVADADGTGSGDVLTLDYVRIPEQDAALPQPAEMVQVDFAGGGDRIRLLGYTLTERTAVPGGTLGLTLYWQALAPVQTDYNVFVHLLDVEEQIRGQGDGPPAAGSYPSSFWDVGEIVVDDRLVAVHPDAPAGNYRLAVGLYELATDRRLSTAETDRVELGEVRIE